MTTRAVFPGVPKAHLEGPPQPPPTQAGSAWLLVRRGRELELKLNLLVSLYQSEEPLAPPEVTGLPSLHTDHTSCPTKVARGQQPGTQLLAEVEGPKEQGPTAGRIALLLYFLKLCSIGEV